MTSLIKPMSNRERKRHHRQRVEEGGGGAEREGHEGIVEILHWPNQDRTRQHKFKVSSNLLSVTNSEFTHSSERLSSQKQVRTWPQSDLPPNNERGYERVRHTNISSYHFMGDPCVKRRIDLKNVDIKKQGIIMLYVKKKASLLIKVIEIYRKER